MNDIDANALNPSEKIKILGDKILREKPIIQLLRDEVGKVIIGQHEMFDKLLIAFLAEGHVLLEGVPGLAKTLTINTLADAIDLKFSRIQFTPDLLPADLTGTMIYSQKKEEFTTKKGPIFSNFVLADEINRAPAKVQSALLEAMQEKQITIGDHSYELPRPFLVLATQNPIEQEGTYPLPEAQLDRFMMKVNLDYPNKTEEQLIIRSNVRPGGLSKANVVLKVEDIVRCRELVRDVYLDEKIEQYIVDIVDATRNPQDYELDYLSPMISHGCSPRASINLALAGKSIAFLQSRAFVIPEDIRQAAVDIMQHRLGLTYEAEAEELSAADIVLKIINKVEIP